MDLLCRSLKWRVTVNGFVSGDEKKPKISATTKLKLKKTNDGYSLNPIAQNRC